MCYISYDIISTCIILTIPLCINTHFTVFSNWKRAQGLCTTLPVFLDCSWLDLLYVEDHLACCFLRKKFLLAYWSVLVTRNLARRLLCLMLIFLIGQHQSCTFCWAFLLSSSLQQKLNRDRYVYVITISLLYVVIGIKSGICMFGFCYFYKYISEINSSELVLITRKLVI